MLVQQMSREIISALDPPISNVQAPFNWTIHTVIEVLSSVVSVEGLLCFEGTRPGAIRGLASKFARSAGMRAAVGVESTF